MGFLNRAAEKQGARLIAAHTVPGEELLHRVPASDESGTFVRSPRPKDRRLDVIATTRAVYFLHGGRVCSILRYDAIAYAASVTGQVVHDRLELVAHDNKHSRLGFPRLGVPWKDEGLGRTIQNRLLCLDAYDESRRLAGREITLSYRPWRPDTMSYWHLGGIEEDAVLRPDIEEELRSWRKEAGEEVLRRTRITPVSVDTSTDWLERDWTEPVTALLRHRDAEPATAWAPGHLVAGDGSGSPRVIAVGATAVHLATFESMPPLIHAEQAPVLLSLPFATMADWELQEPNESGNVLLRTLLLLREEALALSSLEEVVQRKGFWIACLGFLPTPRAEPVVNAVVDGIKGQGAFSPASRTFHPLWSSPEGSYESHTGTIGPSGIALVQGVLLSELNLAAGRSHISGGELVIINPQGSTSFRIPISRFHWYSINRETRLNMVSGFPNVFERERAEWVDISATDGRIDDAYRISIQPDDLQRWDTFLEDRGVRCAGRNRSASGLAEAKSALLSCDQDEPLAGKALAWDHTVDFWDESISVRKSFFWSHFLSYSIVDVASLELPKASAFIGDAATKSILCQILSHPVPLAQVSGCPDWQAAIVPSNEEAFNKWECILKEHGVRRQDR